MKFGPISRHAGVESGEPGLRPAKETGRRNREATQVASASRDDESFSTRSAE